MNMVYYKPKVRSLEAIQGVINRLLHPEWFHWLHFDFVLIRLNTCRTDSDLLHHPVLKYGGGGSGWGVSRGWFGGSTLDVTPSSAATI